MRSQARVRLFSAVRSPRALGVGLSTLIAVLILEAIVDARLTRRAESAARRIEIDSIRSVELVDRIVRDVNRQRVLIDDHIAEAFPPGMAKIEAQLGDVAADLQQVKAEYAGLTELPHEATTWQHIQVLLGRFDQAVARMLALSRQNQDAQARNELKDVHAEYEDIDQSFEELVRINRAGAADSMKRIETLRQETDDTVLGLRVFELLALAALGWWIARRITDYETQILEYTRRLEDRNGNLDAFAGRVAHDLKNTLAPTIIWPQVLRRSAGDEARVREIADNTERCSVRAVAVVDALLAFSRASQEPSADESTPLRAAVSGVLDELASEIDRVGVALAVDELPDVCIRCNAELLHVALANVAGNAVKYLDRQVERRVRISADADAAWCRIEIADTGPGIPKSQQEKIFEPFYRVERPEGGHVHGSGIGLATVRRIVESRGGRVTVESDEARGSAFQLWFLLAVPQIEVESAPAGERKRVALRAAARI